MCAVAVAEAKFVNIAERRPIDISKIPLMRFRLVCIALTLLNVHSAVICKVLISFTSCPRNALSAKSDERGWQGAASSAHMGDAPPRFMSPAPRPLAS